MSSNLGIFEFFNFYEKYRWTETDFANFQNVLKLFTQTGLMKSPQSVLRGFGFNGAAAFAVSVDGGLAADVAGYPLFKGGVSVVNTQAPSAVASTWNLIVARKAVTQINTIQKPTDPTQNVFLNASEACSIVSIDGVLGANAYPAIQANDVIIFGLKIPANAASVDFTMVDYSVTQKPFLSSDDWKYFQKFDAVVGTGKFCTHESLEAVFADANIANIKEILVSEDKVLTTPIAINSPNKTITFKAGVNYSGAISSAFVVTAQGVDFIAGRFQDFTTAAVIYNAGADYGNVTRTRFKNCVATVQDNTVNGVNVFGTHTEA